MTGQRASTWCGRGRIAALAAIGLALSGCATATAATPAPTDGWHLPGGARVVALGDLHGDMAATLTALRLAGAVDAEGHWAGGRLVLVQTGDQVDRGPDDPDIIDLFERLEEEARAAGGAVHALVGNHEIWNVAGLFYSVTDEGFEDFAAQAVDALPAALRQRYPRKAWGRLAAFAPGGPYARKIADRPAVLVVGDTLFVHGGVTLQHLDYGIERLNRETRAWLLGEATEQPEVLQKYRSPTWVRRYSEGTPSEADCAEVTAVLQRSGAARMVMGHTIQEGGITSACDGKVWRIDTGMNRDLGDRVEVLEITATGVRALGAGR